MIFGGMQKCSTIDYPGNIACVLFVRGCNLNCFYCHNRALLNGEGPVVPSEEIYEFLQKRRGLLDGVVISGGEPTLYGELPAFLATLRQLGFKTKLDTNGQRPDVVRSLLNEQLLDYVAVDYKAPEADYGWVTGDARGGEQARLTLELLTTAGVAFEARTTLYPGLHIDTLIGMLHTLPALPRYSLNLFHPPEMSLPEHALLLRRRALTQAELKEALPRLQAAQRGIMW